MAEDKPGAGTIASAFLKKYGEVATIPRDCPWIDPPVWWDKGLRAWGELLTEQWEMAQRKPLTPEQLKRRDQMRRAGQAVAQEMTDLAIEVLTGRNP